MPLDMEGPDHISCLRYTTYDDGVWFECSCGEEVNLGFGCTAIEAGEVEKAHLRQAGFSDQQIAELQSAAAEKWQRQQ